MKYQNEQICLICEARKRNKRIRPYSLTDVCSFFCPASNIEETEKVRRRQHGILKAIFSKKERDKIC